MTMDTVEELAVKPFREVVEKGKMAMQNAGESQDMMKEAQRLVKVGERGLTRIESSCKKLYDEYGINFIRSLKENGMNIPYSSCPDLDFQVAEACIVGGNNCLRR